MGIPSQGASLYRNLEGIIQFLTSFKTGTTGSGAGFEDKDTINAFINGRLDVSKKSLQGTVSAARFSEEVTCTVTRNGKII